jgi:phosphate transport system permease protein
LAAIYLSEIAKKRTRNLLRPLIELLAGIPSVVYGFGLVVIVPLIQSLLVYLLVKLLCGSVCLQSWLPTIITISEDAMRNTACHEN